MKQTGVTMAAVEESLTTVTKMKKTTMARASIVAATITTRVTEVVAAEAALPPALAPGVRAGRIQ